jgi:hypothetical protein
LGKRLAALKPLNDPLIAAEASVYIWRLQREYADTPLGRFLRVGPIL